MGEPHEDLRKKEELPQRKKCSTQKHTLKMGQENSKNDQKHYSFSVRHLLKVKKRRSVTEKICTAGNTLLKSLGQKQKQKKSLIQRFNFFSMQSIFLF
jgi:hypothetical protein